MERRIFLRNCLLKRQLTIKEADDGYPVLGDDLPDCLTNCPGERKKDIAIAVGNSFNSTTVTCYEGSCNNNAINNSL